MNQRNPFWSTYENFIVYLRNEEMHVRDRKEYFYKYVTPYYFDRLKQQENLHDMYFIAELLGRSDR
jgi:hypothetical protein